MPDRSFSNAWLRDQLTSIADKLNLDCTLRLYTNQVAITPALGIGAFTEASWDTYESVSLIGKFQEVQKRADGEWIVCAERATFPLPDAGGPTNVWGIFLTNAQGLVCARAFPSAFVVLPGGLPVRVSVVLRLTSSGFPIVATGA